MGNHAVRYKDLPEVCKSCRFSDDDAKDEYSPNYYFCTKGLYLPTKKNSCKVKDKLRKEQEEEKTSHFKATRENLEKIAKDALGKR